MSGKSIADSECHSSRRSEFEVSENIVGIDGEESSDNSSNDNDVPSSSKYLGNDEFEQETDKNVSQTRSHSSSHNLSKSASIVVKRARKSYGSGKQKHLALDDLHMRVPHGSIYGLLGPSGCGKTTILACLVNQMKLDSGKIYLFGFSPGSIEAAIPGERVGYMPQELALYQDFTIAETFNYFGKLVGVQSLSLEEKINFLVKFLNLPSPKRKIRELSGGQQRRVSFAAAILHDPELLILDEPTVGVDPMLRSKIWKYLVEISKCKKTTIVITTHYIEEARQADKIGLMREGRLLAESTPQNLLDYYKLNSLETVFINLCCEDDNQSLDEGTSTMRLDESDFENGPIRKKAAIGIRRVGKGTKSMLKDEESNVVLVQPWAVNDKYGSKFSIGRSSALIIKNIIRLQRNLLFLSFAFALPPIQTILFCVTVGGNPHDLAVAVVDLDESYLSPLPDLSDMYLANVNEHIIKQKSYPNFQDGRESVVSGVCWALIFFNETYTRDTIKILPDVNDDATIHVYMDDTNQEISYTIKIALYKALEKTFEHLVSEIPVKISKYYNLPLKFEESIYPVANSTFRNFVAPGIILTITFFMAVSLTSLSFIIERREGLLDRSWVAGVKPTEVLFAHLITQTCILIVQITLVFIFMFLVFNIPCEGSMVLVILLSLLQGFCGMSYGFMVSSVAKDELTAVQVILGTFYPLLLMSGIVWPIEGMPTFMRYISYILPQTYACEGLRAVMFRGWGIDHFEVWIGLLITIGWTILFIISAILAVRMKKN